MQQCLFSCEKTGIAVAKVRLFCDIQVVRTIFLFIKSDFV